MQNLYYRSINLGGQKESIYEETNSFEISRAFRVAGRVIDDANKRVEFLKKLETCGIKISERAKEAERKYTRMHTKTHSIKDWTDYDEIAEAMERMYEKEDIVTMRQ